MVGLNNFVVVFCVWESAKGGGRSAGRIHVLLVWRGGVAVLLVGGRAQRMEQWGLRWKAVIDPQAGSMFCLFGEMEEEVGCSEASVC